MISSRTQESHLKSRTKANFKNIILSTFDNDFNAEINMIGMWVTKHTPWKLIYLKKEFS